MGFRKAQRTKAKLRLAITGPAGSGKTYSALLLAFGIGGKIALIDTENGSGDLYANLGDYDICNLNAPYTVEKYLNAIHEAENEGYDVIIIDSLSHAWNGEGGLLDRQSRLAETSRANSYTAWRQITPLHNKLINAMLTSPVHIIATMRSKTEYIQIENERGKNEIKKVGLAPIQRDGMDYEFTTVFDLTPSHIVSVSKDRTTLFDCSTFSITKETGELLREWLNEGEDKIFTVAENSALASKAQNVYNAFLKVYKEPKKAQEQILKLLNGKTSKEWTMNDIETLEDFINKLRASELNNQEVAL